MEVVHCHCWLRLLQFLCVFFCHSRLGNRPFSHVVCRDVFCEVVAPSAARQREYLKMWKSPSSEVCFDITALLSLLMLGVRSWWHVLKTVLFLIGVKGLG